MFYKIIGSICSIGETVFAAGSHIFFVDMHGFDHAVEQSQAAFDCIDSIEGQFFVFLHIFVISKRQAFHGCEKRCQCTIDTACFASDQFSNIRILLLRHDGTAGRIGIIQFDEAVFIAVPEDDLFTETAQMHHDRGQGTEVFDEVVSVGYRIHTVEGWACETEKAGCIFTIQGISCACQRTCTQRAVVHTLTNVMES